jgi:hypothetical protein
MLEKYGNNLVDVVAQRHKVTYTLLDAVTSDGSSIAKKLPTGRRWVQCSIAGTGAVSGTVTWYGNTTESETGGVLLATSTLSGTTTDTTGADLPGEPEYVYCTLASISGTNAAVTASVSV